MNRQKVVINGAASVDGRLTVAPSLLLMFGDKRWASIAGWDEEIDRTQKNRMADKTETDISPGPK